MEIKLNGFLVKCDIVYGRRRTITAKFVNENSLKLFLPKHYSFERFLSEHKDWLERAYKRFALRTPVISGDIVYYMGKPYNAVYVNSSGRKVVFDGSFKVYCSGILEVKDTVLEWLKDETLKYLNKKKFLFNKFNVRSFSVKSSVRRWGSCNAKRDLVFNSRLICLPEELIEYVIYHEIAHLFEMNHSRRFKDILMKFLPDFREREKRLSHFRIQ